MNMHGLFTQTKHCVPTLSLQPGISYVPQPSWPRHSTSTIYHLFLPRIHQEHFDPSYWSLIFSISRPGIGQFSSTHLRYGEKLKMWTRGRQEDFEFDFFGAQFQTVPISILEKQCQAHQVLTGSLFSWTVWGQLFLIQHCVTNSHSSISHMELSSVRGTSLLIWQRCHKPYDHANHIFLLCRHFAESTEGSPAKPRN